MDTPDDSCSPAPGELVCMWGFADGEGPDVTYYAGEGVHRTDQRLLHNVIACPRPYPKLSGGIDWDKSLLDELTERGYDITTLRFSIRKKTT